MLFTQGWRSRIPARRESVLEARGVFSILDQVGLGFGNDPAAAGRGRDPSQRCGLASIRGHSSSTSRVLCICTIGVPYSRQDTSGFPADLDPRVRIRPAE
jgi:hypothetical protein